MLVQRAARGHRRRSHDPYGYTYPNPVWSPLESKLYLFWRGGNYLPNFSSSDDENESWAPAATLMDDNEPKSSQRPYVKYAARATASSISHTTRRTTGIARRASST